MNVVSETKHDITAKISKLFALATTLHKRSTQTRKTVLKSIPDESVFCTRKLMTVQHTYIRPELSVSEMRLQE